MEFSYVLIRNHLNISDIKLNEEKQVQTKTSYSKIRGYFRLAEGVGLTKIRQSRLGVDGVGWGSRAARDHKSPGSTLNMQNKMECDWFKPSKHDVTTCDVSKTFVTKNNCFFDKIREMHNGTHTNTEVGDLIIFLVITNRDFYCG